MNSIQRIAPDTAYGSTRLYMDEHFYAARRYAVDILDMLDSEQIDSSNNKGSDLSKVRQLVEPIITQSKIFMPGLTSCVVTTLLKVGLCQELSQRFILEYVIKSNRKDISLIILGNPDNPNKENHAFVQIGPVNVPESLLVGKNSGACIVSPKEANQGFADFLSENKNGVFADPLCHCVGSLDSGLTPLFEYCEENHLTHVIGVRSFHTMPRFVENAVAIKNHAIEIAEKIQSRLDSDKFADIQTSKVVGQSQAHVFPELDIKRQLNAIDHHRKPKEEEIDLMLRYCKEMWHKKVAMGRTRLEEFRCALVSLLSDMKNYPDLCTACFDLVAPSETNYDELFSSFFSLQQFANEHLKKL